MPLPLLSLLLLEFVLVGCSIILGLFLFPFAIFIMDAKIEINRLSKDELEYELSLYGVSGEATVESMRRSLRQLRRLYTGTNYELPAYPFSFEQDSTALQAKIKTLTDAVEKFSDVRTSSDYLKLSSSIACAFGRVQRSKPLTEADSKLRQQFSVQLVDLLSRLSHQAKFARKSMVRAQSTLLDITMVTPPGNEDEASSSSSDESVAGATSVPTAHHPKPVPVSSWGLKFSGNPKDMSVNAFIERVNELKVARNSNDRLLFASAIDLFTGNAAIWYRANKDTYNNWSDLMVGLRSEFLLPEYDEHLFEEIKHRTQGPNESIGIYVSVMKNLFGRLCTSVPESTRLKILVRNLAPFYQTQLGLVEITSIAQLLQYGKQLEARRASVEAYVPPPTRGKSLEPDLACVSASSGSDRGTTVEAGPSNSIKCWNCGRNGHRSAQCSQQRRRHCFGCGRPNVTRFSCPSCSGNGRRAH